MPKIRDLGIKVIPETMQPPGIGGGAGCGCTDFTNCIGCTQHPTVGCDPGASPCIGGTPCLQTNCQPTHCLPTHPCVPTPANCTPTPCICTAQSCHGCTQFPHTPCGCTVITCHGCSIHPATPCLPTPCGCTVYAATPCHPTPCGCTVYAATPCHPTPCLCSALTCHGCSIHPTPCLPTPCLCSALTCHGCSGVAITICDPISQVGCVPASPVCAGSIDPTITIIQQGGLTQEHINTLKDQLQKQIQALDEHAKTIGPKTSAEIDAREKQLNDELAQLKSRRKDLEKK